MKVFFEFSRKGLVTYGKEIKFIKDFIAENYSYTHDLYESSKDIKTLPKNIYKKLNDYISDADCIVIEGSVISLSIGFVLTKSIELGKPVLFLIREDARNTKNRFVESINSKLLINEVYNNTKEIEPILTQFFKTNPYIKTRFNLVLYRKLDSYITKRSHEFGISKTEYLIDLIQKDYDSIIK